LPQNNQAALAEALKRCETEPIHRLGLIQPHGALIVFERTAPFRIEQASANLAEFFPVDLAQLLGAPLIDLLGNEQSAEITALLARGTEHSPLFTRVYSVVHDDILELQVSVRPQGTSCFLEFEPVALDFQPSETLAMFERVNKATSVLDTIDNVPDYCQVVAELVRDLIRFDRVMIYRFDAQWDGEVIAESRQADKDSYLGNRFPAGDIPPQARQLYVQNLLRVVSDVAATPVPMRTVAGVPTDPPLDLSLAVLRAFSPVHVEYLKNMGVRASLSISIILDGKLWGLIACHHDAPMRVAHPAREMLRFVGKLIGMKLSAIDAQQQLIQGNRLGELLTTLIREVYSREDYLQAVKDYAPAMLALLDASGAALQVDGQIYTFGQVPAAEPLEALLAWLANQTNQPGLATNHLAAVYPPAAEFPETAAGLLATGFSAGGRNGMLWFRPERLRTIQWAGRPDKLLVSDDHGEWRISPRKSFAVWQETWRQRSDDWSAQAIAAAEVLTQSLIEAMVQKSLKQRDEFYRLFGDQTPEMIARHSTDGRFTYVSPTSSIVLGKRPAELLGCRMQDLIDPADRADFVQLLSEASETLSSAVFRLPTSNGQQSWLEISIKRVSKPAGGSELIAISRDVSERQKFLLAVEEFQHVNQGLLDTEGEGVVAVDCAGDVVYANPVACDLLGWPAAELIGRNGHQMIHHSHPDGSPFPLEACPTSVVLKSGQPSLCHDDYYFHRNGTAFRVATATTPIINQGEITGALAVFINAMHPDGENPLIANDQIGAIMTLDREGRITSFSDSLARLTGYSLDESVGQFPSLLKSNVHTRSFFRELWQTLQADKHWQGLIWNRCQDGSIRPFWVSMNAVCDRRGEIDQYVVIYGETTPKSSPEAQLQFLASHDNLTGLPNRANLSRRLRQAIARSTRLGSMLALAFIDMDHFKQINDSFGHAVGDAYLVEVAHRLGANCREEDTIARWGGDEFILLMEDVQQPDNPLLFTQRLVTALCEPMTLDQRTLTVSASVGLAIFPADGQTAASLIQAADRAMYQAKTQRDQRIVSFRDLAG
jgi:diguanylate cyclase (GGDEF)-like protein/PAS domain S-box-containing protein